MITLTALGPSLRRALRESPGAWLGPGPCPTGHPWGCGGTGSSLRPRLLCPPSPGVPPLPPGSGPLTSPEAEEEIKGSGAGFAVETRPELNSGKGDLISTLETAGAARHTTWENHLVENFKVKNTKFNIINTTDISISFNAMFWLISRRW